MTDFMTRMKTWSLTWNAEYKHRWRFVYSPPTANAEHRSDYSYSVYKNAEMVIILIHHPQQNRICEVSYLPFTSNADQVAIHIYHQQQMQTRWQFMFTIYSRHRIDTKFIFYHLSQMQNRWQFIFTIYSKFKTDDDFPIYTNTKEVTVHIHHISC